jgi:tetratricopeptide (TPR) repeat protein
MFKTFYFVVAGSLFWALTLCMAQVKPAPAEGSLASARHAVELAKTGHCKEALPILKKVAERLADASLKRESGFAGVRCAMFADQPDAAIDFLRALNRAFPHDPDVLYLSVHTYSDISTRASAELADSQPASYQAQELSAESLEIQGKLDDAEKIYRQILKQYPAVAGIHYRLGRVLVSKPDFGPAAAEEAKQEFEKELQVDPSNAGAEYVLGELAKQNQQWDEAIQHFSHAAKLDATFGDAFVGWGGSLVSEKKFADAIAPLEIAVRLQSRNPAAHYMLAIAYARSGRKEDGDREFAIQQRLTQKGAAGEPPVESQQKPN